MRAGSQQKGTAMTTFGKRIRELRRQKHMTQRDLADAVDLDFSYISKIENDRLKYSPSFKSILRIARVLDVDELELLELADKVPSILEPFSADEDALRFMRRISELSNDVEVWRDLLDYLDTREQKRG